MNQRTVAATTILVLGLLLLPALALATPSTLIFIPSADVQPAGTVHLGLDEYYDPHGGHAPSDWGVTVGLPRLEAGLDVFAGSRDLYANAKYLITPETRSHPQFVAGVQFLALSSGAPNYNMFYAMGVRSYPWGRVHFGLMQGSRGALGHDNTMVLGGVEHTFSDRWWGAADYASGDSAFGALSAGVAYTFRPGFSALVGYDWYNAPGSDNSVTVQFDYQWQEW